jgi:hypothetical protein
MAWARARAGSVLGIPVRADCPLRSSRDVGMPVHQLLGDALDHVFQSELALILGDLDVQQHLQQQVAHLLAQTRRVPLVQGLQRLAGLLQQERPQRLMGLDAVPGTTVRTPQGCDDLAQAVERAHLSLRHSHLCPFQKLVKT